MRFYSCFADLKIMHSKGVAVFKNGVYETNDKAVINELKNDKSLTYKKSIEEMAFKEEVKVKS